MFHHSTGAAQMPTMAPTEMRRVDAARQRPRSRSRHAQSASPGTINSIVYLKRKPTPTATANAIQAGQEGRPSDSPRQARHAAHVAIAQQAMKGASIVISSAES